MKNARKMKSLPLVLAALLMASLGTTQAATETTQGEAAPAKASDTCRSAGEVPTASEFEILATELTKEIEARPMGGPPPCPAQSDCGGGSTQCGGSQPCGAGFMQILDLGTQSCDGNGQTLHCPTGQTVHVQYGYCHHCPCCTPNQQGLSCACPQDCSGRAVLPVYCQ